MNIDDVYGALHLLLIVVLCVYYGFQRGLDVGRKQENKVDPAPTSVVDVILCGLALAFVILNRW